jgi:hypothetical protein
MTIRVTVHNSSATPGSIVAVRQMTQVDGDTILGPQWFMAPNKEQDFYLHDYQYLVAIEIKPGSPYHPDSHKAPQPTVPQPLPTPEHTS